MRPDLKAWWRGCLARVQKRWSSPATSLPLSAAAPSIHPRSPTRGRTPPTALRPLADGWLLPPAWPLEGWRAATVNGLQAIRGVRIAAWARRAFVLPRLTVRRQRLAAALAITSVVAATLIGWRMGPVPTLARSSSSSVAVAGVSVRPTVAARMPSLLPPTPVPASSRTVAASMSKPVQALSADPAPPAAARNLLADVSTMDLMMPVAEPDLDITSRHSLWSQVGKAAGVDPLLLYSVALVESKALYPDGKVAPTPWLFRVNDHLVRGNRHDVQLAMAAASQFGSAVQDVGIMQVYYPMHRDAVRDPLALLNPRTNITVAAKILRDGMHETHDR
ncbi:MAG TPA: hypothetical protein VN702_01290, partial [Acetobacteraceae bacterium]|nr:hypothetical protein [Acetobacteraceae bacterium]